MQHFIGIDVSKNDFFACFNEQDEAIKFDNNKQGINKFIKHLNKNNYQMKDTQIGLESTGAYHLPLSLLCSQGGYSIKVINPLITKKQRRKNLYLHHNTSSSRLFTWMGFFFPKKIQKGSIKKNKKIFLNKISFNVSVYLKFNPDFIA